MSPVTGNKVHVLSPRMSPEHAIPPPSGRRSGDKISPRDPAQGAPLSLLILGASARAWASSVSRTGLAVHAADLFADRDLLAITAAVSVPSERYPSALVEAALGFPSGPWCYTGALENHPGLVDAITATRPLAGNAGDAIRRVRSARHLAEELAEAGIGFPRTLDDPSTIPGDGSWLRKPRASGGGQGIAPWTGLAVGGTSLDSRRESVWQERCPGLPVSGAFVVTNREARLVGASRQLIGVTAWSAPPYAYCGSIDVDPQTLPDDLGDQWNRIGSVLAGTLGLRGVVGVDAIVTPSGRLVVIEVNPRPTASMELVDRRTGRALAADHLAACGVVTGRCTPAPSGGRWAKGILRAAALIEIDDRLCDRLDGFNSAWSHGDGWPAIADLPRSGTVVASGAPCISLFAVADTGREARRLLDQRMGIVQESIGP
jgi:predicted ATP-grasp superfamily ATP-dependent carboligase